MGIFWQGALAVALMTTAFMGARLDRSETVSASAAAMPQTELRSSVERFRVSAGDNSCLMTKFDLSGHAFARLAADAGCEDVMAGLSTVRSWTETSDGAVLLSDGQGSVLAAFAMADGAGYESYEPRLRPMSLVEAGG